MTKTISRDELHRRIEQGDITVLEALPISYWEAEHLPGALAFPLDDIDGQADRLLPDRSTAIAVYCSNDVCNNSHVVTERLTQRGYTSVFRYTGGKQDWIEAGLPIEAHSPQSPV